MASQGPLFSRGSDTAAFGGTVQWVAGSPSKITADDNSEAQITAATFDTNVVGWALFGRDWGFTIPDDATINGVELCLSRRTIVGSATDQRVSLYDFNAGAGFGAEQNGGAWPATESAITYGSPTTLLGGDSKMTPGFVNSTNFGFFMQPKATANNTDIGVDYFRVMIHYTPAGGAAVQDTFYFRQPTSQGAFFG